MNLLHPNIVLQGPKGKATVAVYEATRGGTKSPRTWYYRYNNRWITPLEIMRYWAPLDLNLLFKIIYNNSLADLVVSKSLLQGPKTFDWYGSAFVQLIVFDKE